MNRKILRLAIPNIISNLSVPLLSTVDTALMGRMESESYIGAVALGALIFNFVYWGFGFLRMGTTGLTAQAFGQQDKSRIIQTLGRAMLVALGSAIVILLLQWPVKALSFGIIDGSETVESLARAYFDIRIWAAPATLALYALTGWFLGMQNAFYPMLLTVFTNAVNIAANIVFIRYFDMKVEGVAWGTVIAQYLGVLLGLALFYKKYRYLLVAFSRRAVLELKALKAFLLLNGDIFIRTFLLIFVFSFFTDRSAAQGDLILAANAVLLQYFSWMAHGTDGFAFAAESLIGQYVGARNYALLNKSIKYSFGWGMGLAFAFTLFYGISGEYLLAVFTDQADVIACALPYLWWIVLLPVAATPGFIWDGIFIGFAASKAMRNTMLPAVAAFLVMYYVLAFGTSLGNHGLWIAFLTFMVIRGVVQLWWYRKYKLKWLGIE